MRIKQFAVLAFASLGLFGCLHSTEPLITAEIADYPIADGQKFAKTSLEGATDADKPMTVIVRREGDVYVFATVKAVGEDEPMKGRMKKIAPDTYLAMAMQGDQDFLYALYTHKDGSYLQYTATCDVLKEFADRAKRPLSDFGTTRTQGNADCEFATLDDVGKAFRFMVESGFTPDVVYAPLP